MISTLWLQAQTTNASRPPRLVSPIMGERLEQQPIFRFERGRNSAGQANQSQYYRLWISDNPLADNAYDVARATGRTPAGVREYVIPATTIADSVISWRFVPLKAVDALPIGTVRFTLDTLPRGRLYYWQIHDLSEGNASATGRFELGTSGGRLPPPTLVPRSTNEPYQGVQFAWSRVAGATGYTLVLAWQGDTAITALNPATFPLSGNVPAGVPQLTTHFTTDTTINIPVAPTERYSWFVVATQGVSASVSVRGSFSSSPALMTLLSVTPSVLTSSNYADAVRRQADIPPQPIPPNDTLYADVASFLLDGIVSDREELATFRVVENSFVLANSRLMGSGTLERPPVLLDVRSAARTYQSRRWALRFQMPSAPTLNARDFPDGRSVPFPATVSVRSTLGDMFSTSLTVHIAPTPNVTLPRQDTVRFPLLGIGAIADTVLTFSNAGTRTARISAPVLSGLGTRAFALLAPVRDTVVGALGDTLLRVRVRFQPQDGELVGEKRATLSLQSEGKRPSETLRKTIQLVGVVQPILALELLPKTRRVFIDDTTGRVNIRIRNTDIRRQFVVDSVVLSSDDAEALQAFRLLTPQRLTLPPGGAATCTLAFVPRSVRPLSIGLKVQGVLDLARIVVSDTGYGVAPPRLLLPSDGSIRTPVTTNFGFQPIDNGGVRHYLFELYPETLLSQPQNPLPSQQIRPLQTFTITAIEAERRIALRQFELQPVVASNGVSVPFALAPSTRFAWRMQALDSLKEPFSLWSAVASFRTSIVLSQPAVLYPSVRLNGSAASEVPADTLLRWRAVAGAAEYRIEYATGTTITRTTTLRRLNTRDTTLSVRALDASPLGKTFAWRVVARTVNARDSAESRNDFVPGDFFDTEKPPAPPMPTPTTATTRCSDLTLTAPTGVFQDRAVQTLNYENNVDCRWVIAPTNRLPVVLSFVRFDTETANDVVECYDGEETAARLLAKYSGNDLRLLLPLVARSGRMIVRFRSNANVTKPGWEAVYRTEPLTTQFTAFVPPNIRAVVGGEERVPLVVRNTTNPPRPIWILGGRASVLGSGAQQFSLPGLADSTGSQRVDIPPRDTAIVTVRFAPRDSGRSAAVVRLESDIGGTLDVSMEGRGFRPVAQTPRTTVALDVSRITVPQNDTLTMRLSVSQAQNIDTSLARTFRARIRLQPPFMRLDTARLARSASLSIRECDEGICVDGINQILRVGGSAALLQGVLANIPLRVRPEAPLQRSFERVSLQFVDFDWQAFGGTTGTLILKNLSDSVVIVTQCDSLRLIQPRLRGARLTMARPNPMSDLGELAYALDQTEHVEIVLMNTMGQRVETVCNQIAPPGEHHLPLNTRHLPSGLYLLVLQTPTHRSVLPVGVVR
jgi:hypothetical protein